MKTRFKVTNFYPLTIASMALLGIGSLLQDLVIVIPPSRTIEVPFAVFVALPAALLVSYVGAIDARPVTKLASRPIKNIILIEQLLTLVMPLSFALLLANWSPNNYLMVGLRDFVGIWGIACLSRIALADSASWFPSAALFFASITAGSSGQTIEWWAWIIAPAPKLETLWLAVSLGVFAIVGKRISISLAFVR